MPVMPVVPVVAVMTDNSDPVIHFSRFLRSQFAAVAACSALVITPCFWHRQLEAGDLPSHTYNAWLAQLTEQGRAPGLYIAHQWTNTLFDFLLLSCARILGFSVGPKVAVALCVLIFFWGVFTFIAAASGSAPWFLSPLIAALAYGYTFNMGFFNYYLSMGLGCFALALFWPDAKGGWTALRRDDAVAGVFLLVMAMLAHPIGPLWCLGTMVYVSLRRSLPGRWRLVVPAAAVAISIAAHLYLFYLTTLEVNWPDKPFYLFNGADQLVTYSRPYRYVAAAVVVILSALLLWNLYRRRERPLPNSFLLFAELYLVSFCVIAMLPQDIRLGLFAAWAGLLVSRLTLISAILAFSAANCLRPRTIVFASTLACAGVFFVLLYRETAAINRLELHAQQLLVSLPAGSRVVPTLEALPDSRIPFVGHVVDRACIGHCFTYSNYEPSSRQFRVRASARNDFATASADDSQEMESGNYVIKPGDPPLIDIYQCSPTDFTILCARKLSAGDKTGQPSDDSNE
jgi:hypothetical protein